MDCAFFYSDIICYNGIFVIIKADKKKFDAKSQNIDCMIHQTQQIQMENYRPAYLLYFLRVRIENVVFNS